MHDKPLRFVAKCIHCGKAKNMHRAVTLDCPQGKRTPRGYATFGPETYEPEQGAKPGAHRAVEFPGSWDREPD